MNESLTQNSASFQGNSAILEIIFSNYVDYNVQNDIIRIGTAFYRMKHMKQF